MSAHLVSREVTLKLKRSVCCIAAGPPGNPEIWWASISEGSAEGGDELGLIGKKFQSGEFNSHNLIFLSLGGVFLILSHFLCTCRFQSTILLCEPHW